MKVAGRVISNISAAACILLNYGTSGGGKTLTWIERKSIYRLLGERPVRFQFAGDRRRLG